VRIDISVNPMLEKVRRWSLEGPKAEVVRRQTNLSPQLFGLGNDQDLIAKVRLIGTRLQFASFRISSVRRSPPLEGTGEFLKVQLLERDDPAKRS
jgi:hypothetical protein